MNRKQVDSLTFPIPMRSTKKKGSSASTSLSIRETKRFNRGDKVEISSKEEGFEGSYYLANIISRISNTSYIVQYRTLLNEDGSGPLREVMEAPQIRLLPNEITVTGFSYGDMVDAYHKDGWWVGEIIGVKAGSNYLVFFEKSGEKNVYPLSLLRLHQD